MERNCEYSVVFKITKYEFYVNQIIQSRESNMSNYTNQIVCKVFKT